MKNTTAYTLFVSLIMALTSSLGARPATHHRSPNWDRPGSYKRNLESKKDLGEAHSLHGNRRAHKRDGLSEQEHARKAQAKQRFERLKKKFDEDGNGQLSDEEKEAMRAKLNEMRERKKEHREALKSRFDIDGDGKLSEDEKNDLREYVKGQKLERKQKRKALKEQFDANNDGKLSKEEKDALKAHLKKNGA